MGWSGLCTDCEHHRKTEYLNLSCGHPIAGEEMAEILFTSTDLQKATAYARIRRRLGLKFKERSWTVIECSGRAKKP